MDDPNKIISKIKGLKEYKAYLIGCLTTEKDNKKALNKLTRKMDKEIKNLLKELHNTEYKEEKE